MEDLEHEPLISDFHSTVPYVFFLDIQFQVQWLLNYITFLGSTAVSISQRIERVPIIPVEWIWG